MPAELGVLDWSTRLILAAVLSGLVGFEREARQKAAGLRTHMLVGLGAALFTLVGAYAFDSTDPSRVAAQVVTGIGFLGAGAIFREGVTVIGLTTAAGLWAVAAIGMTAGSGLIGGALSATVIALVILYGLGLVEKTMRDRKAAGTTRPFGVRLSNLSELTEVVTLTCTLDDRARQVGVDRTDDDQFLVSFNLRPDRIATVVSALAQYQTVVEADEPAKGVHRRPWEGAIHPWLAPSANSDLSACQSLTSRSFAPRRCTGSWRRKLHPADRRALPSCECGFFDHRTACESCICTR
jgi:putative Mg2+ transporter-C (MgtC) family protein